MIVRDTTNWGNYPDRYGIGEGIYHGWIIKDEFGHDLGVREYGTSGTYINKDIKYNNIICCGGFAWLPDRSPRLRYHSCTLNQVNQVGGDTDGSNDLSSEEKKLVDFCWGEYIKPGHGPGHIIPDTYYSMSF